MGYTARELFEEGRVFKVLSPATRRLMGPFIVTQHTPKSLHFRLLIHGKLEKGRSRFRTWPQAEDLILQDRVRWLTSCRQSLSPRIISTTKQTPPT